MKRRLPPPLVALTPGDATAESVPALLAKARAAVEAGLRGVLVREPGMLDGAMLELLRSVRAILPEDGWLGVHDRVHLTVPANADAVHLGFRSLTPSEARPILPDAIAIGFSAHEGDDVAAWNQCDYLFFGPVRETPSKRGLRDPVAFDGLARATTRTRVPIWAIGGLRAADARPCLDAGCAGMAVLSGILMSRDAVRACREYVAAVADPSTRPR